MVREQAHNGTFSEPTRTGIYTTTQRGTVARCIGMVHRNCSFILCGALLLSLSSLMATLASSDTVTLRVTQEEWCTDFHVPRKKGKWPAVRARTFAHAMITAGRTHVHVWTSATVDNVCKCSLCGLWYYKNWLY